MSWYSGWKVNSLSEEAFILYPDQSFENCWLAEEKKNNKKGCYFLLG